MKECDWFDKEMTNMENLEIYPITNGVLTDAIDRICVKILGDNRKTGNKSYLFTGAGANGGTTTVALNIAISLAQTGWKTVFLDCDFRKSQKFKRVDKSQGLTLTEYLTGAEEDYKNIALPTNVKNLDYVLSGEKNDNPVRLLCNSHMQTFLDYLKERYDFIIVDTPPVSIINDAEILMPLIDRYIIVTCLNETKKKQLVSSRIQMEEYEDKYFGVIANRVDMMQYKHEYRDYDYFTQSNLLMKQQKGISKKKGSKH